MNPFATLRNRTYLVESLTPSNPDRASHSFRLWLLALWLLTASMVSAQTTGFLVRAGDTGDDYGAATATDASGNVYVTGRFNGVITFGGTTLTAAGGNDIFLAKYTPSGALLWARRAGGVANDEASGIAVDDNGVFITGSFNSTANFNTPSDPTSNTLTALGNGDIFVAKYDASGTVQWLRRAGGSGDDVGYGIAVDANGVYITGSFNSTANFNTPSDPTSNILTSAGIIDIFVAKYDASGTIQWCRRAGGSGGDTGNGIAVDNGAIYVTGSFQFTANFNTPSNSASNTLTALGNGDIFVAKYDASGAVQWLRRAGASTGGSNSYGIAVNNNDVYVTGIFQGTANFNTPSNAASNTLTALGSSTDIFVAKYDATGTVQWLRRAGGSGNETSRGITLDDYGIYVTGSFRSTANFNNPSSSASNTLTALGLSDIFVAKYDTYGTVLWLRRAGSDVNAAEEGRGVAVNNSGVYVTGHFFGTADFNTPSDPTSNTLTSAGGIDMFLAQWSNPPTPAILSFTASSTAVCVGRPTVLSATVGNVSGSYAYTFTTPSGPVSGTTSDTDISAVWTAVGSGPQAFSLIVSYNDFTTFTTTSATVNANPSLTVTANPSFTIGQGSSVTLTASGATSYTWTGNVQSTTLTVSPNSTTPYSVTGINASGCTSTTSVTVTAISIPCGSVIYVTESGAGLQDGSSWANALPGTVLQAAIIRAGACGGSRQVWVASGTYKPTNIGDRTASFSMRNNVAIYGGFPATGAPAFTDRDPASFTTVLSGDIGTTRNTSDNSYHVISNPTGLTTTALLDGFVITGGNADGAVPYNTGGGMYNVNTNPLIVYCIFQNNLALAGGGLLNQNSSPTLIGCVFQNNSLAVSSTAGGMYNASNSSPTLTNCVFRNNFANTGGGMHNGTNCNPILTNCLFQDNEAFTGGAISNNQGNPILRNCLLLNNSAGNGGGIFCNNPTTNLTLINCTLRGNTGSNGGAIRSSNGAALTLINCVLFDNGGLSSIITSFGGVCQASYSLFDESVVNYSGTNNLTTTNSPFASSSSAALNACSPAINAGLTSATGLVGITTDLAENNRVFGSAVDMGAYEFQGSPTSISLTNPTTTTAAVGLPFAQSFTVVGGTGPYTYTLAQGTVPTGLTLTAGGVLSGTPTQSGTYTMIVQGSDNGGCVDAGSTYTLIITNATPTIAGFAASSSTVCVGSPVTFTATVGNVTGSYNYTLTNGSIPITGSASTSAFSQSWTPTGPGSQSFTLTVEQSGQRGSAIASLTVSPLPTATVLTPASTTLTCTTPALTLTATGGETYRWDNNTTLATRAVSTSGTYSVTVTAANGCTAVDAQVVNSATATISVTNPPLTNPSFTTAIVGQAFSQTFTSSSSGSSPRSFSLLSGTVPTGLTLAASGVLSGTLIQAGNFFVTVQATDANGCSATGALYTLVVSTTATVITATPSNVQGTSAVLGGTIIADGLALVTERGVVYVAGNGIPTTSDTKVASGSGLGSFTQSVTGLTSNTVYSVRAYAINAAGTSYGDVQSFTTAVAPPAPQFITPADGSRLSNNRPTYSGTATPGSSVTLFVDGNNVGQITTNAGGNWTFTPVNPLSDNLHRAYARATLDGLDSPNSTTISFTVDTTPPAAPVVTAPLDGAVLNDNTPTYAGTAEPSSTVTVLVDGSVSGTTTTDGSGNWNYTSVTALTDGTHTVRARATDDVGNTGPTSTTTTFTVDTAQPRVTISSLAPNPTNTSPIPLSVTFSESVAGFSVDDISISNGSLTDFTGLGSSYTVNVAPTTSGLVSVSVAGGMAQDAAGNGNQASNVFTIEYAPAPSIVEFSPDPDPVCPGSQVTFSALIRNVTGSYAYTLTNGTTNLSGTSSDPNFSQIITAQSANGQYEVQSFSLIVSSNGQSATETYDLTVQDLPTPTLTASNGGLLGCNVSSLTLTATGGDDYRFDGPDIFSQDTENGFAVISTTGLYSVTVTNSETRCSNTTSTTITEATSPTATILTPSSTTLTCASPSVSLTATGGETYLWDDNSASTVRTVSAPGTYSVTVSSANGCTATASVSVTADQGAPSVSISSSSTILSCASPSVSLTAIGIGSVRWEDNSTSAIRQVSTAGTYSVTLTASNGCAASTSVTIGQDSNVPQGVLATNTGPLTCTSTTATVSVSAVGNGLSYRWAGPEGLTSSAQSFTTQLAGAYSVTVTSQSSGCSSISSTSLGQDVSAPQVSIAASSTTLSCTSPSVSLTAVGIGSVRWDDNSTSTVRTVSTPGTYSVVLTATNGCTATASVSVTADQGAPSVSISSSSTILSCASPSVSLTAIGTGSVHWEDNSANAVRTVTSTGTYSVTLTAQNGCVASASIAIGQDSNAPQNVFASNTGPLSCTTATVSVSAVGSGLTYRWTGPNGFTSSATSFTTAIAGAYSVTVTSQSSGCSSIASTSLGQDLSVSSVSISSSSTILSCISPSVSLTAMGVGSVRWEDNSTSALRTVSAPGTYSVVLTSTNGCTATASISVTADQGTPSVSINPSSTTLTCVNPTVSLTAVGTGSVRWDDNSTSAIRQVSSSGTYSVTLTNSSGCTATASVEVGADQGAPTVSILSSGTTLSCNTPSLSLTATGGVAYQWENNALTAARVVTASGIYSVTVTAANGCTATTSISITADQGTPSVSISPSFPILSCASPSVSLTAVGVGSVRWDDNSTSAVRAVSAPGTYSVVLTGANGCTAMASVSVTADQGAPSASISPSSATLTCASPTVSLTAVGVGDVRWSTGETSMVISVSVSNTYSVTVTNASGCSATASVMVSQVPDQTLTFSQQPLSATSVTVGTTVTTSVLVSGPALSYQWYKDNLSQPVAGQTGPSLSLPNVQLSDAGSYSVVVSGACNSLTSTAFSLSVSPGVDTKPFAITSVTLLSCTHIYEGRRVISFIPNYTGLTGAPISFSVVNEMLPVVAPAPYSLQLYPDNPIITLKATQQGTAGEASFAYNWLAACVNQPTANTPPQVVSPPQNQTLLVGQSVNLNLAGVFVDEETPTQLTLSATGLPAGLSLQGSTLTGVVSQSGVIPITLTATDPGNLTGSTTFVFTVLPSSLTSTTGFSLVGVTTLSCTPVFTNRVEVSFLPQYSGLTGALVSFSVVNELLPTTQSGPYTLQLYYDNPLITLKATQAGTAGEVSYSYNWLAACQRQGQENTAPVVVNRPGSQTARVGEAYHLELGGVFTDQETPTLLTLTAANLPVGLSLTGSTITGTASMSGTTLVTLIARDPGNLSASVSFELTVSGPDSQTQSEGGSFSITGVQTLSCVVVSGGQRQVTFQPQYAGLNGQPISFSVVNELATTIQPGPYSLNLYTDNPLITLKATQQGSAGEASFVYNWLATCGSPAGRKAAEPVVEITLRVTVLGNPVEEEFSVHLEGSKNQPIRLLLSSASGYVVSEKMMMLNSANHVERISLKGQPAGVYILHVSQGNQVISTKVIRQ